MVLKVTSSAQTKVLAIGISEYQTEHLRLSYASQNAKDIAVALAMESGCGIPRDQLTLLTDGAGTQAAILTSLKHVAASCSSEDVFMFYFSGHGERLGAEFFLLPSDVDPNHFEHTAISTLDFRLALEECQARGVLVILDCCRGAGFAEQVDKFFVTLGGRGFRILLSASRSDQPSFEFTSQQGTIFSRRLIEILRGEVPIGEQPGVVYFSDLYRYLSDKVAEDLETIGQSRTAQEPVAAGTFGADPRLFILRQVSIERIEAETPRYSKRFVGKRLRRALASVAVAVILVLAGYYFYLEHSFYVWVEPSTVEGFEGDYLAVYSGDLRLNALGFPHLVRTTDIPVDALPRGARPGVGLPPSTRLDPNLDERLFAQLSPEWKSIVSAWRGDTKEALSQVNEVDADLPDDWPALARMIDAVGRTVGPSGAHSLIDDNLDGMAVSRTRAAFRLDAKWEPDEAVDALNDCCEINIGAHEGILEGIDYPCDPQKSAILKQLSSYTFDQNKGRVLIDLDDPRRADWFAALLRTNCAIDPKTAIAVVRNDSYGTITRDFDAVALLVRPPTPEFVAWLVRDLNNRVHTLEQHPELKDPFFSDGLRAWEDLRLLAVASPRSVPESTWKLLNPKQGKNIRLSAARALLAKDPQHWETVLHTDPNDPWVIGALAEAGHFDAAAASRALVPLGPGSKPDMAHYYGDVARFFLRQVRRRGISAALPVVNNIEHAFSEPQVKVEAIITAASLSPNQNAPVQTQSKRALFLPTAAHFRLPQLDPRYASVIWRGLERWAITVDDDAFDAFMKHFGSSPDDAAEFLGRSQLSEFGLSDLRSRLTVPAERIAACAVLAMRGTSGDLVELLSSNDLHIRQTAERYAVYNANFEDVLPTKLQKVNFGMETRFYLQKQLEAKQQIGLTLSRIPKALKRIAPVILLNGSPDATPGLSLWVADLADAAEADAIDGAEELDLTNAP